MSGEKKRLEQYLLQTRASFGRFQPENIDRIRLLSQQRVASKVPISERLKKEQRKKRRRARKKTKLRGEVAKNITAQRRFEKGERRDKDTEEPRIVGDPKPLPAGAAYDPEIEARRLDIQQGILDQNRLDRIADRLEGRRRQDAELGVRRGELASARADRALIRAQQQQAPPAQPDIRIEGPTINIPAASASQGAREAQPALADPIPEIQRLSAEIRADTDAFGQEQREINTRQFEELRQQIDVENRQTRETVEAIDRRQQAQDENFRAEQHAQDARNQSIQERLGSGEAAMAEAREAVIRESRESEERLTGALRDLNLPTNYDSVLLEQAQFEEQARASGFGATGQPAESPFGRRESLSLPHDLEPPPREDLRASVDAPEPSQPEGIGGVIGGGGELELPSIVVDEPRDIEASLVRPEPGAPAGPPKGAPPPGSQQRRPVRGTAQKERDLRARAAEGLEPSTNLRSRRRPDGTLLSQESSALEITEPSPEQRLSLSPAEQSVRYPEPSASPEASQERLRLVDTQDFLSGFDRPASPQPEPEPAPEPEPEPEPARGGGGAAQDSSSSDDEYILGASRAAGRPAPSLYRSSALAGPGAQVHGRLLGVSLQQRRARRRRRTPASSESEDD